MADHTCMEPLLGAEKKTTTEEATRRVTETRCTKTRRRDNVKSTAISAGDYLKKGYVKRQLTDDYMINLTNL